MYFMSCLFLTLLSGTCQTVTVASFVCFVASRLCWDKDSFVVLRTYPYSLFTRGKTEKTKWSMETKQPLWRMEMGFQFPIKIWFVKSVSVSKHKNNNKNAKFFSFYIRIFWDELKNMPQCKCTKVVINVKFSGKMHFQNWEGKKDENQIVQ